MSHTGQFSIQTRLLFSKYIRAILTHLCSSRGYFNYHIISVLIDSCILSNNCIVGAIGCRESLSAGMSDTLSVLKKGGGGRPTS
jgi:hypothetical protein